MDFFAHDAIRKSQDVFVKDVDDAIANQKALLAQAPTGIGKTSAVLAPALKHAFEKGLTVFFLTSRHTQHKIVVDTLSKISSKSDVKIRVLDLIGRQAMCVNPSAMSLPSGEFGEVCRMLRKDGNCSYYENILAGGRLSPVAKELLRSFEEEPTHVEQTIKLCDDNELCPYFTALMLGKKANIIVGDYFHVFNDSARDSLFEFADKSLSKSIIIVDEAHNLPDRVRELLSAQATTLSLRSAALECDKLDGELKTFIEGFAKFLEEEGEDANPEQAVEKAWFTSNIESLFGDSVGSLIIRLERVAEHVLQKESRSYCANLSVFFTTWIREGDEFVRTISKEFYKGKKYFRLSVKCMDPSILTKSIFQSAYSSILMSGTLEPLEMYSNILGLNNATLKKYESPFPKKNKLTIVVPDTTTKFTSRSEEQYAKISAHCLRLVNNTSVNSAIFFPSYDFMNKVLPFIRDSSDKTLFTESGGMSKEEKTDFIERFKGYADNGGALLLGVVSGSFAEGYDFANGALKLIIIVGVPLSKPDLYTGELIKYYESMFGDGWSYGYSFPAITRVLQASGRAIRSSTDSGVIVLLDERYAWSTYAKYLPSDRIVIKDPLSRVIEFFSENEVILMKNDDNPQKTLESYKL